MEDSWWKAVAANHRRRAQSEPPTVPNIVPGNAASSHQALVGLASYPGCSERLQQSCIDGTPPKRSAISSRLAELALRIHDRSDELPLESCQAVEYFLLGNCLALPQFLVHAVPKLLKAELVIEGVGSIRAHISDA
jgi:hypothetical protein